MEHRTDAAPRPQPLGHAVRETIPSTSAAARAAGLTACLLATPPEVSMELAPGLLEAGLKVVDLSGAFRLGSLETFERWYPERHTAAALLEEAVYGLPEFYRERIRKARLVANPGCYPTAANLALAPLMESGLIDRAAGIVCDAKSGVSGAGRKPSLKTSFCEVSDNLSAYAILVHRHVPEVLQHSGLAEAELSFTAQLLPIDRGILETIYFRATADSAQELLAAYERRYGREPMVRLYAPGTVPDIRAVRRTNYCDVGFHLDPVTRRAVVVSVIDNLGKGAAGQAIQNLNLMFGLEETLGLCSA